jgi:hypothetical protein
MMPFKILYKSVTGTLYIKHKIVCCLAGKKIHYLWLDTSIDVASGRPASRSVDSTSLF